MFFKKKKRMIDVRDLQRRGVVRLPKKDIVVPTNREGFVEFGTNGKPQPATDQPQANSELFGFANTAPTTSQQSTQDSSRITDLDNKIYKLEQRIELLEKKLDINKPTESSVGPMGW